MTVSEEQVREYVEKLREMADVIYERDQWKQKAEMYKHLLDRLKDEESHKEVKEQLRTLLPMLQKCIRDLYGIIGPQDEMLHLESQEEVDELLQRAKKAVENTINDRVTNTAFHEAWQLQKEQRKKEVRTKITLEVGDSDGSEGGGKTEVTMSMTVAERDFLDEMCRKLNKKQKWLNQPRIQYHEVG